MRQVVGCSAAVPTKLLVGDASFGATIPRRGGAAPSATVETMTLEVIADSLRVQRRSALCYNQLAHLGATDPRHHADDAQMPLGDDEHAQRELVFVSSSVSTPCRSIHLMRSAPP